MKLFVAGIHFEMAIHEAPFSERIVWIQKNIQQILNDAQKQVGDDGTALVLSYEYEFTPTAIFNYKRSYSNRDYL